MTLWALWLALMIGQGGHVQNLLLHKADEPQVVFCFGITGQGCDFSYSAGPLGKQRIRQDADDMQNYLCAHNTNWTLRVCKKPRTKYPLDAEHIQNMGRLCHATSM